MLFILYKSSTVISFTDLNSSEQFIFNLNRVICLEFYFDLIFSVCIFERALYFWRTVIKMCVCVWLASVVRLKILANLTKSRLFIKCIGMWKDWSIFHFFLSLWLCVRSQSKCNCTKKASEKRKEHTQWDEKNRSQCGMITHNHSNRFTNYS